MSNDNDDKKSKNDQLPIIPVTTPAEADGWSDAAAESGSPIRGTRIKFADWKWFRGDGTEIPAGTALIAVATTKGWIRWEENKPTAYVMQQPGRRLPERNELGDDDEEQWELNPDGKPKDPWAQTRFVHLLDPQTLESFTYSTPSLGGAACVHELADQIARARLVQPAAVPLVELEAGAWATRYGRKSRPVLKVVSWTRDPFAVAPVITAAPEPAQIEQKSEADQGKPWDDPIDDLLDKNKPPARASKQTGGQR